MRKKILVISSTIALISILVLSGMWLESKSAEAKVNERVDMIVKAIDELYEYNQLKEDVKVGDIYAIKQLIDKENSKKLTKVQNGRLRSAGERLSMAENELGERLLLDEQLEFIKATIANIYAEGELLETASVETIEHIEKLLNAEENSKLTPTQKALLTTLTSNFNDAKRLFDERLIALAEEEKATSEKKEKKERKEKKDTTSNADVNDNTGNSNNAISTNTTNNKKSSNNNSNGNSNNNKSSGNNGLSGGNNNKPANQNKSTDSKPSANNNNGNAGNNNNKPPANNNNGNASNNNNKPPESKPPAEDVDQFNKTLQDWQREGWILSLWGSNVKAVNRNPKFAQFSIDNNWNGFEGFQSKWGYLIRKTH